MALLNTSDFARFAKVSRNAIVKALEQGRVQRRKDKFLNTKTQINADFVASHNNGVYKQPGKDEFRAPKRPAKKPRKPKVKKKRGRPRKQKSIEPEYVSPFPEDDDKQPENGKAANGKKLTMPEANLAKILSQVEKLNVETEAKRFDLINRDLVRGIFHTLSTIDQNQFLPLAAILAPEVAGMCGKEDNKTIMKVQKLLEKKFYQVLEHRKRAMLSWLKKVKIEVEKENETSD